MPFERACLTHNPSTTPFHSCCPCPASRCRFRSQRIWASAPPFITGWCTLWRLRCAVFGGWLVYEWELSHQRPPGSSSSSLWELVRRRPKLASASAGHTKNPTRAVYSPPPRAAVGGRVCLCRGGTHGRCRRHIEILKIVAAYLGAISQCLWLHPKTDSRTAAGPGGNNTHRGSSKIPLSSN